MSGSIIETNNTNNTTDDPQGVLSGDLGLIFISGFACVVAASIIIGVCYCCSADNHP